MILFKLPLRTQAAAHRLMMGPTVLEGLSSAGGGSISRAMSRSSGKIIVAGGGSRIARALKSVLGDRARYLFRRPTEAPWAISVSDYGRTPAAALEGAECLINCIGVSAGSPRDLARINKDIAERLAISARDAGVRHLIQISSFSVYGGASEIGGSTPVAPKTPYGQ